MKKLLSLLVVTSFAALVACGPSAEEKAAAEKSRQDSISAAMAQMTADSLNAVQAQMEKMRQDSMAMAMRADSMAMAAKKATVKPVAKPKVAPAPKVVAPETPKVGSKKPGAK